MPRRSYFEVEPVSCLESVFGTCCPGLIALGRHRCLAPGILFDTGPLSADAASS